MGTQGPHFPRAGSLFFKFYYTRLNCGSLPKCRRLCRYEVLKIEASKRQCCGTASDTQADQKGRGALRTHPLHVCQIPNSSYWQLDGNEKWYAIVLSTERDEPIDWQSQNNCKHRCKRNCFCSRFMGGMSPECCALHVHQSGLYAPRPFFNLWIRSYDASGNLQQPYPIRYSSTPSGRAATQQAPREPHDHSCPEEPSSLTTITARIMNG